VELADYFRESVLTALAMDETGTLAKSFVKQVTVTIPSDGVVRLPTDCENCVGVLQYTDAAGKRTTRPAYTEKAQFIANRPVCGGGAGSRISVTKDTADKNILIVSPATAGGTMQVSCSGTPDLADLTAGVAIPAKLEPAIFNLMLSYAMGVDQESAPMRARSDVHYDRAMGLLSIATRTPKKISAQ
jgi:hypothetical protein